nr:hypothetical protein A8H35_00635 [Burkholderia thailandensis]AWY68671.1 hypothetical protein A8H36_27730 [Burkholderia thailandensis]
MPTMLPTCQTPNAKRQTPNAKRQTPNAKRQTPNAKRHSPPNAAAAGGHRLRRGAGRAASIAVGDERQHR